MNTVINTNMAAIRTHGVYNRNNTAMNAAMTRVATGLKINSAQDNASGYAITEKMRERIRALDQANQNTQNDTAMMKTAEGALGNTVSILTTLRERAIDASNDSNTDTDRAKIQTEVKELLKQIDTNAGVKYNGKTLIDGTKSDKQQTTDTWFAERGATDRIDATALGSTYDGKTYKIDYSLGGTAQTTISDTIASGITFKTILDKIWTSSAVSSGGSLGTDEAGDTVSASADGLKLTSGTAGAAGAISGVTIKFNNGTSDIDVTSYFNLSKKITGGDAETGKALNFRIDESLDVEVNLGNMTAAGLGISGIDLSSKDGAKAAVTTIETALETALKQQTKIGAYEQRLGYASDNLTTARENIEASASTIADSDIAKEMTNYMRYAVLSQASQYMLSQASQNAFSVLNLLQA
ncbi:MAG: flagellin [Selenomonadaceae bacterium]|nr:flagellin [Selenomonadaceae bacterium]MBR7025683.1 flagellin [Selenomonadaceae bacterium]